MSNDLPLFNGSSSLGSSDGNINMGPGSYKVANWPRLSPAFRAAHNRKRALYGEAPIPEPLVDLYVKPSAPKIQPLDAADKREAVAAVREFMGPQMMGLAVHNQRSPGARLKGQNANAYCEI